MATPVTVTFTLPADSTSGTVSISAQMRGSVNTVHNTATGKATVTATRPCPLSGFSPDPTQSGRCIMPAPAAGCPSGSFLFAGNCYTVANPGGSLPETCPLAGFSPDTAAPDRCVMPAPATGCLAGSILFSSHCYTTANPCPTGYERVGVTCARISVASIISVRSDMTTVTLHRTLSTQNTRPGQGCGDKNHGHTGSSGHSNGKNSCQHRHGD
jgi:hypothetical protein